MPPHSPGRGDVTDIRYGVLAQRYPSNAIIIATAADEPKPAASIVKILIAIALIDADDSARFCCAGTAKVGRAAFDAHNRFFVGAKPGSELPIAVLLTQMIEQSDNFSANVLIQYLGTPRINAIARRIGLTTTRVHGPYRDTAAPVATRTFTTPRDCNRMLEFIVTEMRGKRGGSRRRSYAALLLMMTKQSDRRFVPAAAGPNVEVADKTGEIHGEINDCAIIEPFSGNPTLFSIMASGDFNIYSDAATYDGAITQIQAHVRSELIELSKGSRGPRSAM